MKRWIRANVKGTFVASHFLFCTYQCRDSCNTSVKAGGCTATVVSADTGTCGRTSWGGGSEWYPLTPPQVIHICNFKLDLSWFTTAYLSAPTLSLLQLHWLNSGCLRLQVPLSYCILLRALYMAESSRQQHMELLGSALQQQSPIGRHCVKP